MSDSLPFPSDESLPKHVVQRLNDRPPVNIYRMIANAPQCLIPWTDAVAALYQNTLPAREREIAILRQGARANAHYELHQHRLIALANGLTREEIDGIVAFRVVESLSARENLICSVADQLETNATLDDATFAQATAEFRTRQFVELTLLISFYSSVARFTNATRIPIEKENFLAGRTNPN